MQRRADIEERRLSREALTEERRARRIAGVDSPSVEHAAPTPHQDSAGRESPIAGNVPTAEKQSSYAEDSSFVVPAVAEETDLAEETDVTVSSTSVENSRVPAESPSPISETPVDSEAPNNRQEVALPPVTVAPESLTREELLEREATARAERLAAEMDLAAARRQVELERRRTETERERAESAAAAADAVGEQLSTLQARRQLLEAKAASKAEMKKAKAASRRLAIESRVRSGSASDEEIRDLQSRIAAADARLLSLAEESGLRIRQLEEELQQAREIERGGSRRGGENSNTATEPRGALAVDETLQAVGDVEATSDVADDGPYVNETALEPDDTVTFAGEEESVPTSAAPVFETAAVVDDADAQEILVAPDLDSTTAAGVVGGESAEIAESPKTVGFLEGIRQARALRTAQRDAERSAAAESRRLEQLRREENREDLRRERAARVEARAEEREQSRAEKLRTREEAIRARVEETLAASLTPTLDVDPVEENPTLRPVDAATAIEVAAISTGDVDGAETENASDETEALLSRREVRRLRRENLKAERSAARAEARNAREEAIKLRLIDREQVADGIVAPVEQGAPESDTPAQDPTGLREPSDRLESTELSASTDTALDLAETPSETFSGQLLPNTESVAPPGESFVPNDVDTVTSAESTATRHREKETTDEDRPTQTEELSSAAERSSADVLEIREFAPSRHLPEEKSTSHSVAPAQPLPRLDAAQLRDSLLGNVPEEFRNQIESWLRDIGPETLERITVEDIDRAVRILEDESDEDNLEHLRDVIRDRPPVRITFAEPATQQVPETVVFEASPAEPELRREFSLLSAFSRTGREERREKRTRAKIAREQVRLERTRVKTERRQSLREERQRRREERDETKIQRSLARAQGLSLRERVVQSRMQRQTSRALRAEFREREQLRIRELRAAERALKSEAKQGKRAAAKSEKSQRSLERREERELKRSQRDLQRSEKKMDRSDRAEFKESSRSRSREERRVEKARSRSVRAAEKEARRLEKARTDEETAARKAVVDGEAARLRSEAAQTRQQVRSIRRLERESGRLSRIQEKARKRAEKSDLKAQRSAERARKRETAKQEMEAKAALTRERMLAKESEKIAKRAARVEKLSRGGLPPASSILPAPGGRYDWNTEAGFLGGSAVGEEIDPAAFDLPEGLPSRTR